MPQRVAALQTTHAHFTLPARLDGFAHKRGDDGASAMLSSSWSQTHKATLRDEYLTPAEALVIAESVARLPELLKQGR